MRVSISQLTIILEVGCYLEVKAQRDGERCSSVAAQQGLIVERSGSRLCALHPSPLNNIHNHTRESCTILSRVKNYCLGVLMTSWLPSV